MTLVLDTNYLPPTVAELVDVIGLVAALRLVECAGGIRIWVPRKLEDDHPLVLWLGRQAAQELADYIDGGELGVPRCAEALRATRNRAICEAKAAGSTVPKLARDFGLTERQVFNILAASKIEDARQADMFT